MSQQPIGHAPGNSEKNKWEFKTHSYQIADTGDYDGHYELTNGDITLWTKDDDEETERFLRLAAHFLNKVGINLSDAKVDDLSYQVYLLELEKKQLQERVKELEDKPAGAVWVKASERLPLERKRNYIFRQANNIRSAQVIYLDHVKEISDYPCHPSIHYCRTSQYHGISYSGSGSLPRHL